MKDPVGFGLIKAIVVILILVAVAYVVIPSAIKVGTVWYHYALLKDEMETVAKFKAMETEEVMKKIVVDKAKKLGIELWEEDVIVDKYPGEKIVIDVYYEQDLVLLLYRRRFKFNPVVEEPWK